MWICGEVKVKKLITRSIGLSHSAGYNLTVMHASSSNPLVLDLLLLQILQSLDLLAVPLLLLLESLCLLRALPLPLIVLLADGPFDDSRVAGDADDPRLLEPSSGVSWLHQAAVCQHLVKPLDGVCCNTQCCLPSPAPSYLKL